MIFFDANKKTFFYKAINWVACFLYTQIIVTLIAFPILVSWGLGISYMTFVGNLVFAPLLCGFLFISSLIFFTELLSLPNGLLITTLEYFTQWWHWLLSLGSNSWIVYFAKPPTWILFIIPLLTLWIMRTSMIRSNSKRLVTCSTLLLIVIVLFFAWTQYIAHQPVKLSLDKKFIVQNTEAGVKAIDHGFLNRKKSVDKFVEFELKPALISNLGSPVIDELVLNKPGSGSLATAAMLCSSKQVKAIELPYFKPFESKHAWAQFFAMRAAALENGVRIRRS